MVVNLLYSEQRGLAGRVPQVIFLDYKQNLFNSKNLGEGPEISQMGFGGYKNVTTVEDKGVLCSVEWRLRTAEERPGSA